MGKYFLEEFRRVVLSKAIGRSRESESDGFEVSDALSVVDEIGFGGGSAVKGLNFYFSLSCLFESIQVKFIST